MRVKLSGRREGKRCLELEAAETSEMDALRTHPQVLYPFPF